MINDFTDLMSKKRAAELIQIVTTDSDKYQPLAIETAKNEIKSRNKDITKFEEQYEIYQQKIAIENLNSIQKQQNIRKNTARTTLRGINFIIDILAVLVLYAIVVCISHYGFKVVSPRQIIFINRTTIIAAFLLYFILGESMFQKTLGKVITKTKVVDFDGKKPNLLSTIIRTFCRLIPFDALSYLYDLNGFHDKIAKTIVVKETQF